ncbi:hypothetical protein CCAX7_20860 [Capsulimonas corticalis]|uniref:Uncharacterized protein n=1 Tax=Capsulimonas corticalis TaxID=2219043 RepID=A0A402D2F1_9BACT|nr:hypothetical protein [Capsulimonas corticalis]BDI30035.1 hypothetical protein CCAX7_20860 [Capsulimonas corticalis]
MTQIFTTPLAYLAVAFIFVFIFGHSLHCLIDCAITDEFSKSKKTVWIIILELTSFLGGLVYSIFITRSKFLRITTGLSIVAVIAGMWFFSYAASQSIVGRPIQTTPNKNSSQASSSKHPSAQGAPRKHPKQSWARGDDHNHQDKQ